MTDDALTEDRIVPLPESEGKAAGPELPPGRPQGPPPTDLAGRLAAWSSALTLDRVPAPVVHAARRSLLDITGCALAGTTTPVSKTIRGTAGRLYAEGRCHLMGEVRRLNPMGAAMVNGVACNALEFDNTLATGRVHAAAVVFPAVLAATEATGAAPIDMLAAYVAGLEIAGLVGAAVAGPVTARGWSISAVAGLMGAVAGVARAFRLDSETTGHAMRLAAAKGGILSVCEGTSARATALAGISEEAVRACLYANDGLAGPEAALEGRGGALAVLAGPRPKGTPNPWSRLGKVWSLVDPGLSFKLHPLSATILPAVEEVAHLLSVNKIATSRITRVTCQMEAAAVSRLFRGDPRTVPQAQHSLRFAVGCLLTFGQINVSHLRRSVLEGPGLTEAMDRVRAIPASAGLDNDAAIFETHPQAARVIIEVEDSKPLIGLRRGATGMPSAPLTDEQVEAKFLANARMAGVAEPKARMMARRVWEMPG
jgi:2-methylcitrate dehydratase PrpD